MVNEMIETLSGQPIATVAHTPSGIAGVSSNGSTFVRRHLQLRAASGLISFAFGLVLIYQIGFLDGGLFSDDPAWTPH